MKLSAPIYVLKSQAKKLKVSESITMTKALDRIAQREGFSTWSLLQSKAEDYLPKSSQDVFNYFLPGDLVLVGGRPGHGKTTFVTQTMCEAKGRGRQCFFFSLESYPEEMESKFPVFKDPSLYEDYSNEISADYIIQKTRDLITSEKAVIIVDYLQLLDQQRTKPEMQVQVESLKEFAKEKKCIIIFISQVDRTFETMEKTHPDLDDIRLPNPLDLKLFNKVMFIHNKTLFFERPSRFKIPSIY